MRRNLDEGQLEEMLSKMPKVKDHRISQQIYHNIQHKVEQPRRRRNFFPAAALVAAIMLLAFITPSIWKNMNMGFSGGANESIMEMAVYDNNDSGIASDTGTDDAGGEFKSFGINNMDEQRGEGENAFTGFGNEYYTVSETDFDVENEYVVTIGVTDSNAQLNLPLSFIVPKDGKSYVEKFNEMRQLVAYHVNFNLLGVSTILNDGFTFSEEQTTDGKKKLIVEGSSKHGSYASAQSGSFFGELAISFTWKGYNEVEYLKDGKAGLDIGGSGLLTTQPLDNTPQKAYFRYQYSPESPSLLIRSSFAYENIEDAIEVMQSGTDIPLNNGHASIPEDMEVSVVSSTNESVTLEISLINPFEFNELHIFALEALKMTAKEFGFKTIEFQSDQLDMIGPTQLNIELPTPVAANRMIWE